MQEGPKRLNLETKITKFHDKGDGSYVGNSPALTLTPTLTLTLTLILTLTLTLGGLLHCLRCRQSLTYPERRKTGTLV